MAIITVTYSPGAHLQAFLDSLPAATTRDTLVIMADNGSTDGAPEAAVGPGVELLRTGGNIGYGAAINRAVAALADRDVDPEYFLFVNPDVVFEPGAIDELLACARRHTYAGAVGPRIVEPDGSTYPSARALPTLRNGIGHALLGTVWPGNPFTRAYQAGRDPGTERRSGWLSGSCQLVRRRAFAAVGGFNERYFMYMEDVDLGDRLGRAGRPNIYCPTARIRHAQGHSASSHPEITVPAHHRSAYLYQAARLPHWWQAPVRAALWLGLKAREAIVLRRGK